MFSYHTQQTGRQPCLDCITLPSSLVAFNNYQIEIVTTATNKEMYLLHGQLKRAEEDCLCSIVARRCTYTTTTR